MSGAALPGLVVFAPLPPNRSGIAAYTAELLPELARERQVTVVVATARDVVEAEGARVVSELEYRASPALRDQPHLFQLGNSMDHAHVYRAALRTPGIVVMHDPVLHHLVEALTLGRGDHAGYEAAMAANYGTAGRRLARLRQAGLFSAAERYLLPLHDQVLARARGVIVHSRFAATRIQAPGGGLAVRVVPHHVSPEIARYDGLTQAAARAALGLPAEGPPVLLSLGHVTPAKGVQTALGALGLLRQRGVEFLYVIGGAADPAMDLPRLVREAGLEDRVRLAGWLSEEAFFTHARAADLLLNLRFPVAGETSGALSRALGMGLTALVYDYGPASEYPDRILAKLAYRPEPVEAVAEALAGLLADPGALAARGREARAFMRAACSVEVSARAYLDAIRDWG